MVSHSKQTGLSLLELLLVVVIALFLATLSMRQYGVYRNVKDVESIKQQAAQLLGAVSKYYLSYCISAPDDADQYTNAKSNLDAATSGISLETLAPYLTVNTNTITNSFGTFVDGSNYKMALVKAPFVRNATNFTDPTLNDKTFGNDDYQTRGFDSSYLWKANVTACITTMGKQAGNALAVQALFQANTATADDDTCAGILISWSRLPRNAGLEGSSLSRLHNANAQYVKMNQWAPWMKKSYNDDRFDYVCQL